MAARNTGNSVVRRLGVLVIFATLAMVVGAWTNDHTWRPPAKETLIITSNVQTGFYSGFSKLSKLANPPFPTVFDFSPALELPRGIIFDKSTNLWGTNCAGPSSDGSITEFSRPQLEHLFIHDNPVPKVFIQDVGGGSTLDCPKGLVFLKNNLYVASSGATDGFPAIVEYSGDQLKMKGSSKPDPFTYFVSPAFGELGQLQFDTNKNLWVTDLNNQAVYGWKLSSLNSIAGMGGNATAPLILNPDYLLKSTSFRFLEGSAFDPTTGNLWVTDHHNNQLYAFTPDQITANASNQVPIIIISPVALTTPGGTTNSLVTPTWLSFQSDGYLWVTNSHSDTFGSVAGYAANSIKTSGSPTPVQFLDSDASGADFNHPVSIAVSLKLKF